jgi:hypothetical protein
MQLRQRDLRLFVRVLKDRVTAEHVARSRALPDAG